ncbi:MAG: hypothetical protein GX237_06220 [Clostridiales bacterium]|nr:hypothetical protein [Clostridiales bacterium]
MISLKVEDVKSFMAILLTNTLFDEFVLKEMEIQTFKSFYISSSFHENFFSGEELEERTEKSDALWSEIRGIAFSIIRGNKTPLSMKIVLQLSKKHVISLVNGLGGKLNIEDVGGLYLNIRFDRNELNIITGTAIKTFTLDKTLEQEWDIWVRGFLKAQNIAFTE